MMGRRKKKKARGLTQRKQGNRTRPTLLILCEGQNTEKAYFDAVIEFLKLNWTARAVVVEGGGGQLSRLVRKALQRRGEADEIWCVADRESPQNLRAEKVAEQVARARDGGVEVGLSTPCFEYWYLLHERYTTRSFEHCDELIANHFDGYGKSRRQSQAIALKFANLSQYGDVAIRNAQRVREHRLEVGGSAEPNPATDVDKLVCRLINQSVHYGTRLCPVNEA